MAEFEENYEGEEAECHKCGGPLVPCGNPDCLGNTYCEDCLDPYREEIK